MSVHHLTAFTAGAVVVLVLGTGTAYAATGGDFKLGRANAAGPCHHPDRPERHRAGRSGRGPGYPSLRVNRHGPGAEPQRRPRSTG